MATVYYIYGIDIRDAEFLELSYDNGISGHPVNWGNKLLNSVGHDSYQSAWNRMQQLYKENREQIVGVSFGIIATNREHTLSAQQAEARLDQLLNKF